MASTSTSTSGDIPTIYGAGGPLPHIPDDVTIPQFFLDMHHPLGGDALLHRGPAYFIDDASGAQYSGDKVSSLRLVYAWVPGSGFFGEWGLRG